MKAELVLKVVLPPLIIFAILVALTICKVISGWSMYILWILGFVIANLLVTRVTAKWSFQRRKQQRLQEKKGKKNE
ncbi:hypothetical protein [Limosilactobacillus fastidiosus]|uniref:Uncharacterized protein n=1 Tax=Limosilactobacillus fastidiosus TaxID=2759855 RepID=A0A7W3YCL4_9LACO|nr:hypothetical protein [Limosilactobacillus fastidiosus]MBB1063591.1 hypothetical protein [Limosilactobacillus fastidiosus]MBB1086834.1 hypothetical protein [Limosilactobacillus fastidiosus]MCD7084167.1 hypothetical protein [Limosilactobacillus fastidiosus]MCD7085439.1 hypothetical protein [Limosilactobacillus fastidiosus]MCD7114670.1 hypothetical protein [Limosilactobacillus fastidiosus]